MSVFTTVMLTVGGIVVGVVVTILVARKYRSRKELTPYLLKFESTYLVTEWLEDRVEISYKRKHVQTLERIRLILQNTGNRVLKGEDVLEPIRISFAAPAKIIKVEHFSDFEEYSITPVSPNELEVDFDRMDQNQFIGVEILAADSTLDSLNIRGRVAETNIKQVKKIVSQKIEYIWWYTLSFLFLFLIIFILIGSIEVLKHPERYYRISLIVPTIGMLALFMLLCGVLTYVFINKLKEKKSKRFNNFFKNRRSNLQ